MQEVFRLSKDAPCLEDTHPDQGLSSPTIVLNTTLSSRQHPSVIKLMVSWIAFLSDGYNARLEVYCDLQYLLQVSLIAFAARQSTEVCQESRIRRPVSKVLSVRRCHRCRSCTICNAVARLVCHA